jgi:hypothetical protein
MRDAQLTSSRQNIVDGRVVSNDVVRGDLRSLHSSMTSEKRALLYTFGYVNWFEVV